MKGLSSIDRIKSIYKTSNKSAIGLGKMYVPNVITEHSTSEEIAKIVGNRISEIIRKQFEASKNINPSEIYEFDDKNF